MISHLQHCLPRRPLLTGNDVKQQTPTLLMETGKTESLQKGGEQMRTARAAKRARANSAGKLPPQDPLLFFFFFNTFLQPTPAPPIASGNKIKNQKNLPSLWRCAQVLPSLIRRDFSGRVRAACCRTGAHQEKLRSALVTRRRSAFLILSEHLKCHSHTVRHCLSMCMWACVSVYVRVYMWVRPSRLPDSDTHTLNHITPLKKW